MKFKPVSAIAAILCGTILLFAASMTACAKEETTTKNNVRTAEFELNPPAEEFDTAPMPVGIFHFSFATGIMEWLPFGKPANIQDPAELAMRERNPEKAPAGLDFIIDGEIDMRKAKIVILSEDEIKSILSTGVLPEKKPTTKAQAMKPDSYYLLKDETDQSFYVFRLKDHSPGYVWQQLAYVRIPDGTSWKKNPDLTALLNMPPAIDGLKTITVSGSGVPNLAEGKMKEVAAPQNDLKAYYPAAAKAGDFTFFSQGKSPVQPNGRSFKKEMLQAGCDYFDGVDAYPGEGDTLLLSLNKRCTAIPDDKIESLCKAPAKLVGDYCGVPMDITAAEQPMVLLETSAKKLFLIVGLDISPRGKTTYLEIPRGGISKEQANAIHEYRTLQKKKMNADMTMRRKIQESNRKEAERKQAEEQARQDALDKRIEDVKQQSAGETFPNTQEEINLVYDLIGNARYDELIELCEGKNLDFNKIAINPRSGMKYPLLYPAIAAADRDRFDEDLVKRLNIISKFLLKNGGAAVLHTEWGWSCAREAAYHNNKEVFDLLLENGYDLNQKDSSGKTLLDHILQYNRTIDPEIMNKIIAGTQPSLFSMVKNDDVAGLKKALEDKDNLANINKPESDGKTLLEHAIKLEPDQNSNPEIVRTLLAAGAEFRAGLIGNIILNQKNDLLPVMWEFHDRLSEDDWNQCFDQAVSYKNSGAFRFFLEQGLDPEKKLSSGRSPLTSAYRAGTKEMVDLLAARGFKISFGVAVRSNDLDLVKEYLASGVDVNADDDAANGKPISLAVFENHLEMAELLIEHGASVSPDYYRREGKSYPLRTSATLRDHAKMTELLLQHGFVPDFPETPGDTKNADKSSALYMALSCGEYESAKVLLKYGARTDVTVQRRSRDSKQKDPVLIDVGLEEIFKNNSRALEVLRSGKSFFDFR